MDDTTFSKQDFYKVSKNMKLWKTIREKLGHDRVYLLDAMIFMESDNTIDFSNLGYSNDFMRKIRLRLQDKGVVMKLKLGENDKYKRYINPLIQNYGRTIDIDLIRQFSKMNKEQFGYKRDNRSSCFKSIK